MVIAGDHPVSHRFLLYAGRDDACRAIRERRASIIVRWRGVGARRRRAVAAVITLPRITAGIALLGITAGIALLRIAAGIALLRIAAGVALLRIAAGIALLRVAAGGALRR